MKPPSFHRNFPEPPAPPAFSETVAKNVMFFIFIFTDEIIRLASIFVSEGVKKVN
jgi:hypothetical protein